MAFTSGELRDFVDAVRGSETSTECVVTGTVSRVDPDGTAWVQIGQNPEPTPCQRDMACHAGDEVTVRIADHRATVTGNASAPATDDKKANVAYNYAGQANETATIADERAVSAMRAAQTAEDYATSAQASAARASGEAAQAHQSAVAASSYATTALAGLGTVQSVGETLAWIAQHGQMVSTADTSIDPTKVYFVQDPNGEYTVGGVRYSIVKTPKASGLGTYYELKMLDSVQNYLTTHLAVTEDGLHVFGESGRVIVGESAGFHVTISPDKLAFCQGQRSDGHGGFEDNEIAWVSNNELHVPKAVITDGLQVGHWRWTELSNGNFALKYIA